ncbi:uncharacterized protein [Eucyclogobius newberryi]|uniref:uncharacterized protein n=1 Tax=Eucyclogobius newberryi TaxID=166745 RepID=UPI003B5CECEF
MYSNQSNYGQRRPLGSGESRPWDEEAKREEWTEPLRNSVRAPYNNYNDNDYNKYNKDGNNRYEDGNNRAESVSSRGHNRKFMRGNISHDGWRRKRTTSTEKTVFEKKRRTFGNEDQHRYQPESGDSYRQSPEPYSHAQRNEDFKHTVSVDEGYSHKRAPEESGRYNQRPDDSHFSQYKEESHYGPPASEYWDREGPERNWSKDGTHSQGVVEKTYSPPRPLSGSFSRDHEDHNHSRTMFPLNGSTRQTEPSRQRLSPPPIPPPPPLATRGKKMSKGFQRFLNVLNMGVNVDTLTKIVNQGSPDVKVCHSSPPPPYADRPWAVKPSQRPHYWPDSDRTSPSRSYSSNGKTMSEERFVDSRQFERKFPENRSVSPARQSSNFEDDNKRRQMHNVLQAIGINLEFEEVGQMSSRIEERLYGKKQIEHVSIRKEEHEREGRRSEYVSKRRTRSLSESSSGSLKNYRNTPSYKSQKEETDLSYYTDSKPPVQMVSPTAYARPNPELHPVIPTHGSLLGFPHLPHHLPPVFVPPVPQYHPTYPQTAPPFPPMNIFPPVVPQNAPAPPPGTRVPHPFLPNVFIPAKHPPVEVNVQKQNNKNLRPRCLQVISTKMNETKM